MRVLISPARQMETTKPPMWITYVKVTNKDDKGKSKEEERKENPHLGLSPKDYPIGPPTLREGSLNVNNHGALSLREYHHGQLTPRSTHTLDNVSQSLQDAKPGTTLEIDETLKDILSTQTRRLSRKSSTFQLHPVTPSGDMIFPWHSKKASGTKKRSAKVTNIVKEHSKSRVTTFEDGVPATHQEGKVPPLDLTKLEDEANKREVQRAHHRVIPPIQAAVNEPDLNQTIGVRAHLDLYRDSRPPPSPFTYKEGQKKKKGVVIVAPKLPKAHIEGHLDSVRSEGVTRAMDSYNDYSLTRPDKKVVVPKKKVVFVTPKPDGDFVNTGRLADGVSQALSSYEGDNFAQPEPLPTKKKLIIVKSKKPKEEPYFEACRSDGVKGALDFYNDYGLTPRDVPPYVSPRGQEAQKITEMDPPAIGELRRDRIKSGGVRNTISSYINMDDSVPIKDILATKKRVKTLPTVTPRNPNAIFIPKKDSHEVGVIGALSSYNDSSLTPRAIAPVNDGSNMQMVPRFGPTAQPPVLLNALEIADKTHNALDTARTKKHEDEVRDILRNEERYKKDYPDPTKYLPTVHDPDRQKEQAKAEDWRWKGPTSAKYHWRTDARKRATEKYPDVNADAKVNNRMHNREFKGPMYLL